MESMDVPRVPTQTFLSFGPMLSMAFLRPPLQWELGSMCQGSLVDLDGRRRRAVLGETTTLAKGFADSCTGERRAGVGLRDLSWRSSTMLKGFGLEPNRWESWGAGGGDAGDDLGQETESGRKREATTTRWPRRVLIVGDRAVVAAAL